MGSSSKGATTSTSAPPPEVMAQYEKVMAQANQVAATPYQPYTGQLVAGFTPQQEQAFATVADAQGIAQPYYNAATQYATLGAAPITSAGIAQYYNPYQQDVINATLGNLDLLNKQQQTNLQSGVEASGGLFNDRFGVAQAELAGQQAKQEAPTIAGLEQSGFTQALNAAQAQQQMYANAGYQFGNLGQSNLQAILSGANAEQGMGALQQQLAQLGLGTTYQQWQQAQAYPFQDVSWLSSLSTGLGSNMGGTSTTTPPMASQYAPFAGLGIAALGAFANRGGGINRHYNGGGGIDRRHYDFGGPVPTTPWGNVAGAYIPTGLSITKGSGPPKPPGVSSTNPLDKVAQDAIKLAGSGKLSGLGSKISGAFEGESSINDITGDLETPGGDIIPGYRGGRMTHERSGIHARRGYAEGGPPDDIPIEMSGTYPGINAPVAPESATWGDLTRAPIPEAGRRIDEAEYKRPSWMTPMGSDEPITAGISKPAEALTKDSPWTAQGPSRTFPASADAAAGIVPPGAKKTPEAVAPEITRPDYTGEHESPVATRTNNPFNQWPSAISQRYGGTRSLGLMNNGRDNPAIFPDAVSGAASGFALMGSQAYVGRTAADAIAKWSGGTDPAYMRFVEKQSGVSPDTVITPEFLASDQGRAFMKAMARYENGHERGEYPLSDEQWRAAQREGLLGAPASGQVARSGGTSVVDRRTGRNFGDAHVVDHEGNPLSSGEERKHLFSPEVKTALLKAGFALMANRSPYLAQAVGDAGLVGIGSYQESKRYEAAQAQQERGMMLRESQVNMGLKRLDLAQQRAQDATDARTHAQATRDLRAQQSADREARIAQQAADREARTAAQHPPTYRWADEAHTRQEYIPGGAADPNVMAATSAAKKPVPGSSLDEDQLKRMAAVYNIVGGAALTNIGRGAQGSADIMAIRKEAARQDAENNVTPQQRADAWSRYQGDKAAQRTLSTMESKMGAAGFEAEGAIQLTRDVIPKVYRTGVLPINELIQRWQKGTLNTDQYELMTRLQGVENTYAAVMSRGASVVTDSARNRAHDLLNSANNPEVLNRVLDTMRSEIHMAINSPDKMREFYRKRDGEKALEPVAPGSPASITVPEGSIGTAATAGSRAFAPADQRAYDWAKAHPDAPQAKKIFEHLGVSP